MPTVELVYDSDCPNVAEARAQLLRAFAKTKIEPRWKEWQGDAADSPEHVRGYGSPTILIDGQDVGNAEGHGGSSCRLYEGSDGAIRGVPSVDMIATALERQDPIRVAVQPEDVRSWKLNLAMLPGIGAVFLPNVACPACWPAYAGFLSSMGLGFLLDATFLLPLTAAFLAIAVGALAYRANKRRGYVPFALGVASTAVVLVGKFTFERDPAMYAGLAVLIGASVWNTWPRRAPAAACAACVGEQHSNP